MVSKNNYLRKYSDFDLHEIATTKQCPEWVKDKTAEEAYECGYFHALTAVKDDTLIVEVLEDEC
jgi:hypothetical protein